MMNETMDSLLSAEQIDKVTTILNQVSELSESEKHVLYLKLPDETEESSSCKEQSNLALRWIKKHYVKDKDICVPKQDVYKQYRQHCETSGDTALNSFIFGKMMKLVFPNIHDRRLGQRGQSKYCYGGLRMKENIDSSSPVEVLSSVQTKEDLDLYDLSCQLVCEWATQLLGRPFADISSLSEYLVSKGLSCGKTAAKFTLLSGSKSLPKLLKKGRKSPNSKHHDRQMLLQRKLRHNKLILEHKEKLKQQQKQLQEQYSAIAGPAMSPFSSAAHPLTHNEHITTLPVLGKKIQLRPSSVQPYLWCLNSQHLSTKQFGSFPHNFDREAVSKLSATILGGNVAQELSVDQVSTTNVACSTQPTSSVGIRASLATSFPPKRCHSTSVVEKQSSSIHFGMLELTDQVLKSCHGSTDTNSGCDMDEGKASSFSSPLGHSSTPIDIRITSSTDGLSKRLSPVVSLALSVVHRNITQMLESPMPQTYSDGLLMPQHPKRHGDSISPDRSSHTKRKCTTSLGVRKQKSLETSNTKSDIPDSELLRFRPYSCPVSVNTSQFDGVFNEDKSLSNNLFVDVLCTSESKTNLTSKTVSQTTVTNSPTMLSDRRTYDERRKARAEQQEKKDDSLCHFVQKPTVINRPKHILHSITSCPDFKQVIKSGDIYYQHQESSSEKQSYNILNSLLSSKYDILSDSIASIKTLPAPPFSSPLSSSYVSTQTVSEVSNPILQGSQLRVMTNTSHVVENPSILSSLSSRSAFVPVTSHKLQSTNLTLKETAVVMDVPPSQKQSPALIRKKDQDLAVPSTTPNSQSVGITDSIHILVKPVVSHALVSDNSVTPASHEYNFIKEGSDTLRMNFKDYSVTVTSSSSSSSSSSSTLCRSGESTSSGCESLLTTPVPAPVTEKLDDALHVSTSVVSMKSIVIPTTSNIATYSTLAQCKSSPSVGCSTPVMSPHICLDSHISQTPSTSSITPPKRTSRNRFTPIRPKLGGGTNTPSPQKLGGMTTPSPQKKEMRPDIKPDMRLVSTILKEQRVKCAQDLLVNLANNYQGEVKLQMPAEFLGLSPAGKSKSSDVRVTIKSPSSTMNILQYRPGSSDLGQQSWPHSSPTPLHKEITVIVEPVSQPARHSITSPALSSCLISTTPTQLFQSLPSPAGLQVVTHNLSNSTLIPKSIISPNTTLHGQLQQTPPTVSTTGPGTQVIILPPVSSCLPSAQAVESSLSKPIIVEDNKGNIYSLDQKSGLSVLPENLQQYFKSNHSVDSRTPSNTNASFFDCTSGLLNVSEIKGHVIGPDSNGQTYLLVPNVEPIVSTSTTSGLLGQQTSPVLAKTLTSTSTISQVNTSASVAGVTQHHATAFLSELGQLANNFGQNMSGQTLIQHNSGQNMSGQTLIQHNSGQNMSGQLVQHNSGQSTSGQTLVLQNSGQITNGQTLVQQNCGQNMSGQTLLQYNSGQNMSGQTLVQHNSGQNMSGQTLVQHNSGQNMSGQTLVQHNSGQNMSGQTLIQHNSGQNMSGQTLVQQNSGQTMSGQTLVQQSSGQNTSGQTLVQQNSGQNMSGQTLIKHNSSSSAFHKCSSSNIYKKASNISEGVKPEGIGGEGKDASLGQSIDSQSFENTFPKSLCPIEASGSVKNLQEAIQVSNDRLLCEDISSAPKYQEIRKRKASNSHYDEHDDRKRLNSSVDQKEDDDDDVFIVKIEDNFLSQPVNEESDVSESHVSTKSLSSNYPYLSISTQKWDQPDSNPNKVIIEETNYPHLSAWKGDQHESILNRTIIEETNYPHVSTLQGDHPESNLNRTIIEEMSYPHLSTLQGDHPESNLNRTIIEEMNYPHLSTLQGDQHESNLNRAIVEETNYPHISTSTWKGDHPESNLNRTIVEETNYLHLSTSTWKCDQPENNLNRTVIEERKEDSTKKMLTDTETLLGMIEDSKSMTVKETIKALNELRAKQTENVSKSVSTSSTDGPIQRERSSLKEASSCQDLTFSARCISKDQLFGSKTDVKSLAISRSQSARSSSVSPYPLNDGQLRLKHQATTNSPHTNISKVERTGRRHISLNLESLESDALLDTEPTLDHRLVGDIKDSTSSKSDQKTSVGIAVKSDRCTDCKNKSRQHKRDTKVSRMALPTDKSDPHIAFSCGSQKQEVIYSGKDLTKHQISTTVQNCKKQENGSQVNTLGNEGERKPEFVHEQKRSMSCVRDILQHGAKRDYIKCISGDKSAGELSCQNLKALSMSNLNQSSVSGSRASEHPLLAHCLSVPSRNVLEGHLQAVKNQITTDSVLFHKKVVSFPEQGDADAANMKSNLPENELPGDIADFITESMSCGNAYSRDAFRGNSLTSLLADLVRNGQNEREQKSVSHRQNSTVWRSISVPNTIPDTYYDYSFENPLGGHEISSKNYPVSGMKSQSTSESGSGPHLVSRQRKQVSSSPQASLPLRLSWESQTDSPSTINHHGNSENVKEKDVSSDGSLSLPSGTFLSPIGPAKLTRRSSVERSTSGDRNVVKTPAESLANKCSTERSLLRIRTPTERSINKIPVDRSLTKTPVDRLSLSMTPVDRTSRKINRDKSPNKIENICKDHTSAVVLQQSTKDKDYHKQSGGRLLAKSPTEKVFSNLGCEGLFNHKSLDSQTHQIPVDGGASGDRSRNHTPMSDAGYSSVSQTPISEVGYKSVTPSPVMMSVPGLFGECGRQDLTSPATIFMPLRSDSVISVVNNCRSNDGVDCIVGLPSQTVSQAGRSLRYVSDIDQHMHRTGEEDEDSQKADFKQSLFSHDFVGQKLCLLQDVIDGTLMDRGD